ncbi:MAG: D-tyrosyl-tRNA(Tyr) deacylase [Chloroflexi bacterium]|nr:D-tyrosyl-tRNA(Tyr) deacylase [Chloroflexota bacterium]MCH9009437.1 D-tyrosyl-tRNA(Tyr) deacylase [Chloroflexota bacterium]
MRALVQRVTGASVTVEDETIGSIGTGLVVFIGISSDDDAADADYLANKIANLRIFSDDEGRFDRSALDLGAELLIVSQFTLYADTRKGRRPSFTDAAPPEQAEALFAKTVEIFRSTGLRVETGRFQAHMLVNIANDGPVTIYIDSAERKQPRRG